MVVYVNISRSSLLCAATAALEEKTPWSAEALMAARGWGTRWATRWLLLWASEAFKEGKQTNGSNRSRKQQRWTYFSIKHKWASTTEHLSTKIFLLFHQRWLCSSRSSLIFLKNKDYIHPSRPPGGWPHQSRPPAAECLATTEKVLFSKSGFGVGGLVGWFVTSLLRYFFTLLVGWLLGYLVG